LASGTRCTRRVCLMVCRCVRGRYCSRRPDRIRTWSRVAIYPPLALPKEGKACRDLGVRGARRSGCRLAQGGRGRPRNNRKRAFSRRVRERPFFGFGPPPQRTAEGFRKYAFWGRASGLCTRYYVRPGRIRARHIQELAFSSGSSRFAVRVVSLAESSAAHPVAG